MHSCVTSKNVKWCHLIWPTLYTRYNHEHREVKLLFKSTHKLAVEFLKDGYVTVPNLVALSRPRPKRCGY